MSVRLILTLLPVILMLAGCSSPSVSPPSSDPTPSVCWSPPAAPTAEPLPEAAPLIEALRLCQAFTEDMAARYPAYAPSLSAADVSYYECQFASPDADWSGLTAEMARTIVNLRQQTYRKMEDTLKLRMPLPDGLEDFVRDYESRFREIGW